jgi:hypothetical protein
MALHVSGVRAHRQERQDLKLKTESSSGFLSIYTSHTAATSGFLSTYTSHTTASSGFLSTYTSHTAAAHASSSRKQLRTPYAAVLSLVAPDDGRIRPKHVEPSTIKFYIVALSWFFHAHVIVFIGFYFVFPGL